MRRFFKAKLPVGVGTDKSHSAPSKEAGATSRIDAASSASVATPKKKGIDPRIYSSTLLTLLLVVGQWKFQILGDFSRMAVALGTAVTLELLLSRWMYGTWPNLLSAYISGNSVVILTRPAAGILWPFWGGAALAIVSKYVLQYRGRHLWNPTNLSMCVLMALAPSSVTILSHEWGNAWAMVLVIWSIGLFVVWRAKVWHLTLSYLAAFALLAFVRTLFNGQSFRTEVAPVTGAMYTLFMFFMVTDPKTIVRGRAKQIVVVLLVALVECVIRMARDFDWIAGDNPLSYAPPMYALFLVGPLALWFELRTQDSTAPNPAPRPLAA
jgi:hypothetical protein